jgi:hypothetical protein
MGLRPDQINTMTNHMLEKLFAAYQAIMEKEVRKTFRGILLYYFTYY